ncbi:unnamed protein product [Allacma fusca]|uniref:Lipoprotein n=1 Tax=Allacma fusca TaxID=39272 RepID=A0A8J2KW14_9HEXA|nr:unnamed protein product [Allacma fusca]
MTKVKLQGNKAFSYSLIFILMCGTITCAEVSMKNETSPDTTLRTFNQSKDSSEEDMTQVTITTAIIQTASALLNTNNVNVNAVESENEIEDSGEVTIMETPQCNKITSIRDNLYQAWLATPKLSFRIPVPTLEGISIVPPSFDLFDLKKMLIGEYKIY